MQKKNEPTYCVGCQDKDVIELDRSFDKYNKPSTSQPKEEPLKLQKTTMLQEQHLNTFSTASNNQFYHKERNETQTHYSNGNHGKHYYTNGSQSHVKQSPIDTLNDKIVWATDELKSSTNVRYNIELCEMIKSASEALLSLKRVEM
jgi:hypothetical protein